MLKRHYFVQCMDRENAIYITVTPKDDISHVGGGRGSGDVKIKASQTHKALFEKVKGVTKDDFMDLKDQITF